MSQQYLADQIGVSKMTICELERGSVKLTVFYMRRIAEVFGIPPVAVLDESDHDLFLSAREAEIVRFYRNADLIMREVIDRIILPRGLESKI